MLPRRWIRTLHLGKPQQDAIHKVLKEAGQGRGGPATEFRLHDSEKEHLQKPPECYVFPNPLSENSLSGYRIIQSSLLIEISLIQNTCVKENKLV